MDFVAGLTDLGRSTANCTIDDRAVATICGSGPCSRYLAPNVDPGDIAELAASSAGQAGAGDPVSAAPPIPSDIRLVFHPGTVYCQARRLDPTAGHADRSEAHAIFRSR